MSIDCLNGKRESIFHVTKDQDLIFVDNHIYCFHCTTDLLFPLPYYVVMLMSL